MVEDARKCISVNKRERKFDANLDAIGWVVVIIAVVIIVFGAIFLFAGIDYLFISIMLIISGAVGLIISFSVLKCRTGEKKK